MQLGQQLNQRQNQQQKQVQKLSMTQQMQQSLQILQLNSQDLLSFITSKVMENPLIDVKMSTTISDSSYKNSGSGTNDSKTNFLEQLPDNDISLFESLIDQIHLNYRDTFLRQLVLYLTEHVDVNGYLNLSIEDAVKDTDTSYIQMIDALTLLQQLDPAGVGARNLQECLMLQTERNHQSPNLAYQILEEDFDEFVNRKWANIATKYEVSINEIQQVFDFIQTLTPYPGAAYNIQSNHIIIPDLIVDIDGGSISLRSTKSSRPAIVFQKQYFDKMSRTDDKEVKQYLKSKRAEFDWLEKSIQQRGDTILRVGQKIIEHQKEFFLNTERPIKPLTLKQVAKEIEVHESTVSRTVNEKYLQTSFGTFELRSFFTNAVSANNNEDTSSTNIKKKLRKIIEDEDKTRPFSDQQLVEQLKLKEIEISRRTVAKYRVAEGIPSSKQRKRYD